MVAKWDYEKKLEEIKEMMEKLSDQGMCDLLCKFPTDDLFLKEFHKKKKTDASNFPEGFDQLETHVQDYYRFFSADWLVMYKKYTKYRQVKEINVRNLNLEHEVDLLEKKFPKDSECTVQADPLRYEYLRIPSYQANNPRLIPKDAQVDLDNEHDVSADYKYLNVMHTFHPNFDYSKSLAHKFGNLSYPTKVTDPNSLKVFKQPAKIQFLVETGKPVFALGDLEPWFCTLALYDLSISKKISENFYFDHNDVIKQGMLGINETTKFKNLSKAIFTVETPGPEIYLVLIVEKVLQGDIEECREPYIKATNLSNKKRDIVMENVPKFCKRLGKYRQMFAWSFLKVFDEKSNFRLDGQQEFNPVYPHNPKDNLFELLHFYIGDSKDKKKKQVSIPGACRIQVSKLQPQEYIPDRLDPSLYPYKTNQPSENPKYSRDVQEFEQNLNKFPYTDYINDLYVYPITANFGSFDRKFKNIAVKVELRETDDLATRPLKLVYGNSSFDQTLTTSAVTDVIYKSRQPLWHSEIKVKLPHRLYKDHHLLFTFYHIAVDEPKSKKDAAGVATVIGHSICYLYTDNKSAQLDFFPKMLLFLTAYKI